MDTSNPWEDGSSASDVASSHDTAISNYLMTAVQRDVARRNSLESAKRHVMAATAAGQQHSPPQPAAASAASRTTNLPSINTQPSTPEDKIVYEALLAAGRAVRPDLQSVLDLAKEKEEQQQKQAVPSPASRRSKKKKKNSKDVQVATPLFIPSSTTELPSLANVQLDGVTDIHPHDVLCGRGGSVNNHAGNEKYRHLVQSNKVVYCKSTKGGKLKISEAIVRAVRNQNPPGRFLHQDKDGTWYDIGDSKARDKTSQALREGAPMIRESLNRMSSSRPPSRQTTDVAQQQHSALSDAASFLVNPFLGRSLVAPPMHHRHRTSVGSSGDEHHRSAASMPSSSSFRSQVHQNYETTSSQHARRHILDSYHDDSTSTATMDALTGSLRSNSSHMAALRALASDRHHGQGAATASSSFPPSRMDDFGVIDSTNHAARIIAAAQAAAANAGPIPNNSALGDRPVKTAKRRLVAGPEPRAASSSLRDTILANYNDWEAGRPVPNSALFSGLLGSRDRAVGAPSSSSSSSGIASPPYRMSQFDMQQQRTRFVDDGESRLGNAMCSAQHWSDASPYGLSAARMSRPGVASIASSVPSLPVDLVHRLILAETFAQRSANGTITETMKTEEKRMGLYLDAGLLGVDLGEMVRAEDARTEESIVNSAYSRKKGKDVAHKQPCSGPPKKRMKLSQESTSADRDKGIQDALVAIGAMITLKSQGAEPNDSNGSDLSNHGHESVAYY